MAAGKSTWKRNKLLTARRNYFVVGGDLKPITMPTQAPGITAQMPSQDVLNAQAQQNIADFYKAEAQKTRNNVGIASGGGDATWTAGGVAGAAGALASMTTNMVNNIAASDIKARKQGLMTQANNAQMVGQSANDSFDSLANDMSILAQMKHVDKYDLGAKKGGAVATESITEGLKGAAAGFGTGSYFAEGGPLAAINRRPSNKYMGGGPIGAIVGGVLGTGMSLVGNLVRNHKAAKAAREVNEQIDYTNAFNERSLMNRAENLGASQLAALEQNYAAYGGMLDFGSPIIDYDFMDRYLRTKELTSQGQDDSSVTTNVFAKGGGIHIKPSKRGTFTAAATKHGMGVQEFANKVLANKEDYSPAMVKKANFAKNASKWHAFGGELNTQGLDFTNGLLQINEGGSHEANPYEGVLMGIDQEGAPNLVEEGETIYNDYVFSNRLTVPKAIREKYKLRSTKPMTFAEASKKLAKESEERPNDPISQRGLEAMLQDLAIAQEEKKARKEANKFSRGGRVNRFDSGGYYDMSPFMSALSGYSYSKTPGGTSGKYAIDRNLFKNSNPYMLGYSNIGDLEGSAAYQNFTNAVKANPDNYMDYLHALDAGTAPGVAKLFNGDTLVDNWRDLYDARRTDSKGGIYHWTPIWQEATTGGTPVVAGADGNPVTATTEAASTVGTVTPSATDRYYIKGANGYELVEGDNPLKYIMDQGNFDEVRRAKNDLNGQDFYYDPRMEVDLGRNNLEWLRYAPAIGFGISTLTDALGLTNKPDYSNADLVMSATRNAYTPQVRFNPIGNYLAYNPLDREFYINQLNATAGANRRAIAQNAGLNRGASMAALLASDNNAQNQLGLFARQAEEYNLGQRQLAERFNRETNMFNSEGFLKADIANQQAAMSGRDFALRGTIAAAEMRDAERARADAARSANLSGLFQTLGDIGYEAKNDNMVRRLIETGALGPGAQRAYLDEKRAKEAAKEAKKSKKAKKSNTKSVDEVSPGDILPDFIPAPGVYPGVLMAAYGGKLRSKRRRKGLTV